MEEDVDDAANNFNLAGSLTAAAADDVDGAADDDKPPSGRCSGAGGTRAAELLSSSSFVSASTRDLQGCSEEDKSISVILVTTHFAIIKLMNLYRSRS